MAVIKGIITVANGISNAYVLEHLNVPDMCTHG